MTIPRMTTTNLGAPLQEAAPDTHVGKVAKQSDGTEAGPASAGAPQECAPQMDHLPTDWRELVDMSHIERDELRERVLTVFERHKYMWFGSLVTVNNTEHPTDLVPGTVPVDNSRTEPGRSHVSC